MKCLAVARRRPGNFSIYVYRLVDLATNEEFGCLNSAIVKATCFYKSKKQIRVR